MKELKTDTLKTTINNNTTTLIDIRPIDAYNGWALQNEPRGGHIKGAKAFPFSWTKNSKSKQLINNTGITKNQEIIVYGYNSSEIEKMAKKLEKEGYQNIYSYPYFVKEWAND